MLQPSDKCDNDIPGLVQSLLYQTSTSRAVADTYARKKQKMKFSLFFKITETELEAEEQLLNEQRPL